MNNKEPIVIGKLKKEKSSKPFLAFLIIFLILGTCFGLPYIKSYFGDDYDLKYLLGGNIDNNESSTNTSTTTHKKEELISCKKDNDSYIYTFSNLKLSTIDHKLIYQNIDQTIYEEELSKYQEMQTKLKELNIIATITKNDNTFTFEVIIDKSSNYTEINDNYYSFDTKKDDLIDKMTNKGYDCK